VLDSAGIGLGVNTLILIALKPHSYEKWYLKIQFAMQNAINSDYIFAFCFCGLEKFIVLRLVM
jgi:hypothetical protein